MRAQVLLLPQLVGGASFDLGICIVIDILRATTTLTTLLEYGVQAISIAPDVEAARAEKAHDPAALLLGEIGGLRPADFDFGNSPTELIPAQLTDQRAICQTSNGTAAIRAVDAAPTVLLGCLRNATAVMTAAYQQGRADDLPITVVCAGGRGGRAFALDDTLVAGQLLTILQELCATDGDDLLLDEAALAACTLHLGVFGTATHPAAADWQLALEQTAAGQHLIGLGLGADIPFCAQLDSTTLVPVARPTDQRVLVTTLAGGVA